MKKVLLTVLSITLAVFVFVSGCLYAMTNAKVTVSDKSVKIELFNHVWIHG